jgi:hypothetical protein
MSGFDDDFGELVEPVEPAEPLEPTQENIDDDASLIQVLKNVFKHFRRQGIPFIIFLLRNFRNICCFALKNSAEFTKY